MRFTERMLEHLDAHACTAFCLCSPLAQALLTVIAHEYNPGLEELTVGQTGECRWVNAVYNSDGPINLQGLSVYRVPPRTRALLQDEVERGDTY